MVREGQRHFMFVSAAALGGGRVKDVLIESLEIASKSKKCEIIKIQNTQFCSCNERGPPFHSIQSSTKTLTG